MCLAIPAKIVDRLDEHMATVDIMGVSRKVSLDLVPEAEVGEFVLVHAGFALNIITDEDAEATLELLRQIPELLEEELGEVAGGL